MPPGVVTAGASRWPRIRRRICMHAAFYRTQRFDACPSPRHFPQRRRPAVAVWQGQEVCQVPQVLDEAPDCRLWRVPVW